MSPIARVRLPPPLPSIPARVISDPPTLTIRHGLRVLREELVVDLGRPYPALHEWDPEGRFCWRSWREHTVLRIPAGFAYDGASLPWWALPILGDKERWEVAGAAHDALYREGAPRDVADAVFHRIARSGPPPERVGPVRGWIAWAGLRIGGWVSHRRRTREREIAD